MLNLADRALQMMETKAIRHVRTEAGVRRYKQPIGSIIINDSLLVGLKVVGEDKKNGITRIEGANGKKYTIQAQKLRDSNQWQYTATEEGNVRSLYRGLDEVEAYALTARIIQEDAGLNVPSGRLSAGKSPRERWSYNQIQAASDEIAAWGNSMEGDGSGELQDELYNISDRLTDHGDLQLARHELEQLRDRARSEDKRVGNKNNQLEDNLDSAISTVVSEGKLKQKYNAAEEAEYVKGATEKADQRSQTPTPIKTANLTTGMWVRTVDKDDKPTGDWFQITNLSDQSHIPGRSRLVRGKDRDGNKKTFYRMGPRDKWQTVRDVTAEPAFVPLDEATPTNVSKRVDRLQRGDYTTIGGDTGWVADFVDKDDYSSAARRKSPIYNVTLTDDKKGTVNKRTVQVPRGTMSGPQKEAPADQTDQAASNTIDLDTLSWTNYRTNKSEYDGYTKIVGDNGRAFYADIDEDGWDLYDADDNLLGQGPSGDTAGLSKKLEQLSAEPITASTPNGYDAERHPNLSEAESEYDGYDKFVSRNGTDIYLAQEDGNTVAYDKNDKEIGRSADRGQLLDDLNDKYAPKQTGQQAPLKRLKSKYAGWKRFKMKDGQVVDVGNAADDDGRWYATGKGGWEEIVADGDTEDEVMGKLRVMAGVDQPTSFSPGNTDVAPKRSVTKPAPAARSESPVAGMSREEYDAARRRTQGNNALRSAVVGSPDKAPRPGAGRRGGSLTRDDYRGTAPGAVAEQNADEQLRQDEAERAANSVLSRDAAVTAMARGMSPSWSSGARERVNNIGTMLRNDDINVPEAARRLDEGAESLSRVAGPDRSEEIAGLRTLARTLRGDSKTPNVSDRRREELAAARQGANAVNQNMRETLSKPASSNQLSGIEAVEAMQGMRNGKPLTKKEERELNIWGTANGQRQNRLAPPKTINLYNRWQKFQDQDALSAITDKATENYLDGMTPSAGWKAAIEEAENIADTNATKYRVKTDFTHRGVAQYVVRKTEPDGTELYVRSHYTRREADKAAAQANEKARNRAVREWGRPSAPTAPENASAASTAPARPTPVNPRPLPGSPAEAYWKPDSQTAEMRQAAGQVILNRRDKSREHMGIAEFRQAMAQRGYTDRAEVDRLLRELGNGERPPLRVDENVDQKRITAEDRAAGLQMGSRLMTDIALHPINGDALTQSSRERATPAKSVSSTGSRTAVDPVRKQSLLSSRKRDDPAYKADYERGWRQSGRPNRDIEKADARGENSQAFYDGWSDRSIGEPKWSTPDSDDRAVTAPPSTAEARKAEIQANIPQAFHSREQQYAKWMSMAEFRKEMANRGYTDRAEVDQALLEMSRGEGKTVHLEEETNQKALTRETREAAINIGGRDQHAISLYGYYPQEDPARVAARAAIVRTPVATGVVAPVPEDIARQAASITEPEARELARHSPARFMRVVATRYFRPDGDFKNLNDRDAYDDLWTYADEIDAAPGLGRRAVESALNDMKLRHGGTTTDASRTMMTIRKVLSEEFGK